MQNLTPAGENIISDIAARYNLTTDSAIHMLVAVNNGGGSMAQFNVPEFGGGQWMRGGMTMVGDMFNHGLKASVDNLCNELSTALATTQIFPVIPHGAPGSNQWWPAELGAPFSSGAQNNVRYAIFPNRLAVEKDGNITLYDTLDHQIGGVSQQQGNDTTLSFSSQYGTISVATLPIVSGSGTPSQPSTNFASPPAQPHFSESIQSVEPAPSASNEYTAQSANEAIELLEKLGRLRDAGVITSEEFEAKKTKLLSVI